MNLKTSTPVWRLGTLAAVLALALPAAAVTLRIANQGDALSMDPHSLNESLQITVVENVYEPLIWRDDKFKLTPMLATSWKQTAPTVWRFELRKGVTFHDGTPFTADDVIFSYERAKGDGSDMKTYVGQIKEIKKLSDHSIDIITNQPFPILPEMITHWNIMSKKWCEENQATKPVDRRKGIENAASFRANGTGPFRLRERQPGVRTTFTRNGSYWGQDPHQCRRSDLHPDWQRRHPRGSHAVGRGRCDGARAGARRRAHQSQRQAQCVARPRAAGDLFGHGPSA